MERNTTLVAALSVCTCLALNANADIIAVSGDASVINPPVSLDTHDFESSNTIFAIRERQNLVLPYDLPVDVIETGYVSIGDHMTPGLIPAGSILSSFLIHSDTDTGRRTPLTATFSFEQPILGVISATAKLIATDADLGFHTTLYSLDVARGMEYFHQDSIEIAADRMSITVTMVTSTALDEIRVITGEVVPAPGTLALFGGATLLARPRRRR